MTYRLLLALLPAACVCAQNSNSTEARMARVEDNLTNVLLIKANPLNIARCRNAWSIIMSMA
jgi:glycine cleavage system regulatory protein